MERIAWIYMFSLVILKEIGSQSELKITPYPIVYVTEYSSVTLTCSFSGNSADSSLFMLYNSESQEFAFHNCLPTPDRSMYQLACPSEVEFTITILNVSREQHGNTWYCIVHSGTEVINSSTTQILVIVPVEHVSLTQPPSKEITVEENQETTFTCTTSVGRPRSTILWYIEDNKDRVKSLSGGNVSFANNDTLTSTVGTITNRFKRGQNGSKIYCVASNTDEKTMVSSNKILIDVLYNCPPKAVEKSTTEVFAVLSQSIVLKVSVHAYPIPTSYRWYKEVQSGWQLISVSRRVSISTEGLQSILYIDNLTEDDLGLYGVSVYNGLVGNLMTKRFYVLSKGPPGMPIGFVCRLVSAISNSVLVSWIPETDGGFEQTFHVQYKQYSQTEWTDLTVKENRTKDKGSRSVVLQNLRSGFSYQIRMLARNSRGNSPITEKWTVSIPDIDKALSTKTGAVVGGSIGGFLLGVLVSLLGIVLYMRFCRSNKTNTSASASQCGKEADGADIYYNVTAEEIGEDTGDRRPSQSACTSGQLPNVYEELPSSREADSYEHLKLEVTR